jgi:hypothetical protein
VFSGTKRLKLSWNKWGNLSGLSHKTAQVELRGKKQQASERERRFPVYEEAPGFNPCPRTTSECVHSTMSKRTYQEAVVAARGVDLRGARELCGGRGVAHHTADVREEGGEVH